MSKIVEYVYKRNWEEYRSDLDNKIANKIKNIIDKHFIVRCNKESCKVILDPGEVLSDEEKNKLDKVIKDNRLFSNKEMNRG